MPLRRFLTDTATIWIAVDPDPDDPFGDQIWGREVIDCCIASGGETQTDQDGAEFQPQTTYWTDVELIRGMKIKAGEHTSTQPPADVETIRKVGTWTPHPRQSREWVGYTG